MLIWFSLVIVWGGKSGGHPIFLSLCLLLLIMELLIVNYFSLIKNQLLQPIQLLFSLFFEILFSSFQKIKA
jgi:hypothetical protein